MSQNEHIGKAIKRNRERLGLTQLEFAVMAGFHPTQLQKYEDGLFSVPVDGLVRIADVLGMSMSEFINDGDPMSDELRLMRLFRRIEDHDEKQRLLSMAAQMAGEKKW